MDTFFNSTLRIGNQAVPKTLNPGGQHGDWSPTIRAQFTSPFGAPIPGKPKDVAQELSVVATPRSRGGVPVIAVIETVDSAGFTFRVRNTDPDRTADTVSIDYLAVLGVPDQNPTAAQQMDARLSVLQPKQFSGFLNSQDWSRIWFSRPMTPPIAGSAPFILLTESDLHGSQASSPAAVGTAGELENSDQLLKDGIIDGVDDFGFSVHAVDVDTVGGSASFHAAAFVANGDPETGNDGPAITRLWFDQGSEKHVDTFFKDAIFPGTPFPLSPGGQSGDWRNLDVYFDRPFLTPPLVFACGRGRSPLVCVSRKVTTHGFTMSVRNTDTVGGHALFFWVAIGSDEGRG